ncbi:hypothetical protein [Streptomyces sp. NPDC053427]
MDNTFAVIDNSRSKKKAAITAEFDRHIDFLAGIWNDALLSQLP